MLLRIPIVYHTPKPHQTEIKSTARTIYVDVRRESLLRLNGNNELAKSLYITVFHLFITLRKSLNMKMTFIEFAHSRLIPYTHT